jgi:putative aldouronate transport system substrate-binding protein
MVTSNGGTSFIKVNKDGSIESLLESSLVREGSIYQRRVFQAGLIMPDLLSIPRDTYMTQYIEAGKGLYSYAGYWERLENSVPGANVTALDFAQSTESVISTYFLNSNAISTTSKHPEAAIQLMNWIETRENGQLLCYGILGEDWKKSSKGDQYYIPAKDDGGYFFDMWEFLPYQFRMYLESTPEWMLNVAPPEKVYYAQNAGFIFDAQPVLNEWTNLDAKYNELVWPLFMGMIDYDSNITRIMREFRSLGLDKYMAEYERQFRLWQAGQGK